MTTLIKNHKIHSSTDILSAGNLHWFHSAQERYKELEPKKQKLEDMKFEEITIFNKPALFTPS